MLRVKNNDIYFARGETSPLKFEFWTKEGTPYILPANQKTGNLASYADVFTDGDYAKVEYEPSKSEPAYRLGKNNAIDFRNGISQYNIDRIRLKFCSSVVCNIAIAIHGLSNVLSDSITPGASTKSYLLNGLADSGKLITSIDISITPLDVSVPILCWLYGIELVYKQDDTFGAPLVLNAYKSGTIGKDLQKATEFPTIAFTVRSGSYDSIVLEKYLNLKAPPMYGGDSDYAAGGYNKFTTDQIMETNSTSVSDSQVISDVNRGIYRVYHSVDSYGKSIYQQVILLANGYKVVPYVFNVVVVLNFEDTEMLEAKTYIYDVIAYEGITKGPQVFQSSFKGFPYSSISWKKELIQPHKLVIEDTNNA